MKKRISMMAFPIIVIIGNVDAQVSNVPQDTLVKNNIITLKDLKKAEPGDINPGMPMMLDPSTTPMYNENFVLIKEGEFMKIMMSGDFIPEPYIDSHKAVKAFVLRKATELEKEKMKEMQASMQNTGQNNSELIGKEAFPFSVTDILGNKYSLEKLKGKVIVINFWFVECKPCVKEIPELNDLVEKFTGKEVVFLGFAINDKSTIESFLKTKNYKYNIIADSKNISELYNISGFPSHIVIDKNSIISYYYMGFDAITINDLERTVEELINK